MGEPMIVVWLVAGCGSAPPRTGADAVVAEQPGGFRIVRGVVREVRGTAPALVEVDDDAGLRVVLACSPGDCGGVDASWVGRTVEARVAVGVAPVRGAPDDSLQARSLSAVP
jgi:hypothetical protein